MFLSEDKLQEGVKNYCEEHPYVMVFDTKTNFINGEPSYYTKDFVLLQAFNKTRGWCDDDVADFRKTFRWVSVDISVFLEALQEKIFKVTDRFWVMDSGDIWSTNNADLVTSFKYDAYDADEVDNNSKYELFDAD